MDTAVQTFVAECFWPDVHDQDVRDLDDRLCASAADRIDVRYRGSFLIKADEVVLCQFEGTLAGVRELVERARVPCERILETTTLLR